MSHNLFAPLAAHVMAEKSGIRAACVIFTDYKPDLGDGGGYWAFNFYCYNKSTSKPLHSLRCDITSLVRLQEHWNGFVEENSKSKACGPVKGNAL